MPKKPNEMLISPANDWRGFSIAPARLIGIPSLPAVARCSDTLILCGMATALSRPSLAGELEDQGFIRAAGALDPGFMDSLLLRAHATLFRESAESRDAVKSNGSLIHLADNPEYAEIIASPVLLDLLRECGATEPRFTAAFWISNPAGAPPLSR